MKSKWRTMPKYHTAPRTRFSRAAGVRLHLLQAHPSRQSSCGFGRPLSSIAIPNPSRGMQTDSRAGPSSPSRMKWFGTARSGVRFEPKGVDHDDHYLVFEFRLDFAATPLRLPIKLKDDGTRSES